ncbi:MAG: o-succinylbenzoate synthase [Clostridia bacterium]|nr:o-succinylbenzoate synthase [Clostridia bacterium]
MKITKVILRHVKMRLLNPFTTSFMTMQDKEFILVEALDSEGCSGWGESVALTVPLYKEETLKTNWHIMEDFLIPLLLNKNLEHPEYVSGLFSHIKGNYMAKSALEGAVWDLYAKKSEITLAQALGGEKSEIEVGISLGIQDTVQQLISLIDRYVSEGYKRIKVKIKPGWDVEVIKEIRHQFPDIPLMADANSAYSLKDLERLKALDDFNLMMIEQPLAHDDIIDHAQLQSNLKTPICLDESIHSVEDARKAIKLGSCKIINIKIGRVGGLTQAKKIHDLCFKNNVPVWCGGMLESGIGRAHNLAITTLPNFSLPGDTAASSRYWKEDIIEPEVTVDTGLITVPASPGIGFKVNRKKIDGITLFSKSYS